MDCSAHREVAVKQFRKIKALYAKHFTEGKLHSLLMLKRVIVYIQGDSGGVTATYGAHF
jgi:intergrase/recombinase